MVHSSSVLALNTVVKPALSMTVCVNHLLSSVLLRHISKSASFFQNICGWIVQEHDEFPVSICFSQLKRFPEAHELPLDQLPRMFLRFFVPADDPAAAVDVKRALKCESFCCYDGVILISLGHQLPCLVQILIYRSVLRTQYTLSALPLLEQVY